MQSDTTDDETLCRRIQNGEHAAFAILVHRHSSRFYRLAYRYTRNHADAEDIVQDAFLHFWQEPGSWNADKNTRFTTWFYRIIVNRSLNWLKKAKPVAIDDGMVIADNRPTQEQEAALTQEQALLEQAISALPERQQTALNLCFYEGVSNAEAAEIMKINLKALQSLLMRAKATLSQRMQAYL